VLGAVTLRVAPRWALTVAAALVVAVVLVAAVLVTVEPARQGNGRGEP
jgi:hypothetical protein